MGKRIYLDKIEELFKKSPVVGIKSIERIIHDKKKQNTYQKQVLRNLIKNKKIKRITKGYYTIHEDPSLIVFCFSPSYLGLQNALTFHHLWDQATVPVVLTPNKIRQGLRTVFGLNTMIRRINKKYIFGFEYYKDGDFYFPYSDIEKTFIDMVYFRQPMDKEVIREFKKKIDKKKLNSYLKKYPEKFRIKVLKIFIKN